LKHTHTVTENNTIMLKQHSSISNIIIIIKRHTNNLVA